MSVYTIPAKAGKPYRPSNGTEADVFQGLFCGRCRHFDPQACDELGDCTFNRGPGDLSILARSFWSDVQDQDYPSEWIHDPAGSPTCTAFEPDGGM